jgi:hypothetical protein
MLWAPIAEPQNFPSNKAQARTVSRGIMARTRSKKLPATPT